MLKEIIDEVLLIKTREMKTIHFIIILLLFSTNTKAVFSDVQVRRLTIDDGFSENICRGIIKDSKGFIWKAGFYYLDRYDGYNVKSYLVGDKNINFTGDRLIDLFEDKSGDLWVISDKGFLKFDRETGSFELTPFNYSSQAYTVDEDNNIWLAANGLFILNKEEKIFKKIIALEDSITNITNIGDELWLSVKGQILRYNKISGKKEYFNPLENLKVTSYEKLYKDPNGLIWVLDSRRLFLLNTDNPQFWEWSFSQLPDNEIPCKLSMDKSGNLWIASESGCYIFSYTRDQIFQIKHDPNNPNSIQSNLLTDIFIDDDNMVWLTSLLNGISYIDLNQKPFGKISRTSNRNNTLSGNSVYALTQGPGNTIWVGTENGLDNYNYETNSFKHTVFSDGQIYWVDYLTTDEKGNIYFSEKNSKILRIYHPDKGTLESYDVPVNSGIVRCILLGKNKKVYIGLHLSSEPLVIFDPVNKSFTPILTEKANKLTSGDVLHLVEDNNGLIWIGIKSGCLIYNPFASTFNYLQIQTESNVPLNNTPYVHYIHQQKDNNNMWFATAYGLFKLENRNTGVCKKYDMSHGLPSNTIENILEDEKGNLWLGTNRGLCKFNPETGIAKKYSIYDGIQGNHFEHFAACLTRSGKLCFGGPNGFNIFTPGQIQDNPFEPRTEITGFKVFYNTIDHRDTINGRVILKHTIEETDTVILKANEKAFSIQYSGLHYSDPGRNQYAYYLEGFEEKYNNAGNIREATYTNLPPGDYVFRVKASNNDGIWNESSTSLTLIIQPPWWRTTWAYIGYIIFLGLTSFFGVRIIHYQNRLKHDIKLEKISKEKEAELTQMKLRFFTNISHEFKTPLTLIIGYLDQVVKIAAENKEIQEALKKARYNSQRLLKLITQLIDFRKSEQDVLQLNKRNEDIIHVIKQVTDSFQSYARVNNLSLSLHSQMETFPILIDRDKIENVLYNLISNAIKFSFPGGKVDVNVVYDVQINKLFISVSDTGIGIAPQNKEKIFERFYQISKDYKSVPYSQMGSGIGLSFSKKLIELHGGEITLESTPGKGSVFTFSIPVEIIPDQGFQTEEKLVAGVGGETGKEETTGHDHRISIPDKNAPSILIVEDNSEMREFLRSILWNYYRVEEAENGKTGLDLAIQDNPDLIISDIMMPVMDGIALCKALKTNILTSHIPVILLSAKNDLDTKLEGMELNIDDYIDKPFSQDYLLARVKNILNIRAKLKSHFSNLKESEVDDPGLNPLDKIFLAKALKIIEEQIADPEFSIKSLSQELHLSRVQLYRKFSSITGLLPKDYIKQVRLNKAARLLKERELTVAEIAYAVGYSAPSNFNFAFKAYFGKTPKEYQEGAG